MGKTPMVSVKRTDYAKLERLLSSAVQGLSVVGSLFDASLSQIGSQTGPAETDLEFLEEGDPALAGQILTQLNAPVA